MKSLITATLLAATLSTAMVAPATAQSFSGQNIELEQAVKRSFRLGTRSWRIFALAKSIGLSTVEAHAEGVNAFETGQKIGTDIATEVVGTIQDAAYVATYGLRTLGTGVSHIFSLFR